MAAGQYQEALQLALRNRNQAPHSSEASLELSFAYACNGYFQEAFDLCDVGVGGHEQYGFVWQKGQICLLSNSYSKALALFESLPMSPEWGIARCTSLCLALLRLGRYKRSLEEMKKAVDLDPTNVDVIETAITMGQHLNSQLVPDKLMSFYVDKTTRNPVTHNTSVPMLGSEKLLQAYLDWMPSTAPNILLAKCISDLEAGRTVDVDSIYRIVEEQPTYYLAHYTQGRLMDELGNLGEAAACYRKAITLRPSFLSAWGYLAHNAYSRCNYTESLDCCNTALGCMPIHHRTARLRIKTYLQLRRPYRAFEGLLTYILNEARATNARHYLENMAVSQLVSMNTQAAS